MWNIVALFRVILLKLVKNDQQLEFSSPSRRSFRFWTSPVTVLPLTSYSKHHNTRGTLSNSFQRSENWCPLRGRGALRVRDSTPGEQHQRTGTPYGDARPSLCLSWGAQGRKCRNWDRASALFSLILRYCTSIKNAQIIRNVFFIQNKSMVPTVWSPPI